MVLQDHTAAGAMIPAKCIRDHDAADLQVFDQGITSFIDLPQAVYRQEYTMGGAAAIAAWRHELQIAGIPDDQLRRTVIYRVDSCWYAG
jgi:hypothetical protein